MKRQISKSAIQQELMWLFAERVSTRVKTRNIIAECQDDKGKYLLAMPLINKYLKSKFRDKFWEMYILHKKSNPKETLHDFIWLQNKMVFLYMTPLESTVSTDLDLYYYQLFCEWEKTILWFELLHKAANRYGY